MSALPWRLLDQGSRPAAPRPRVVPGIIPVPLKDACRVYPPRIAMLRRKLVRHRMSPGASNLIQRQISEMERRMSLANCAGFKPLVTEGTVPPPLAPIISEGSVPAPVPFAPPPRPFIQSVEKLPRWVWAVGGLMVLMILKK
jgi:hypothetical protein